MKKDADEALQECKNKLQAIIYAKENMEEVELAKTPHVTVIKRLCSLFEIYTCVVWDGNPKFTTSYDDKTAGEILTMYFLTNTEFADKTMLTYLQNKEGGALSVNLCFLKRVKTFKHDKKFTLKNCPNKQLEFIGNN